MRSVETLLLGFFFEKNFCLFSTSPILDPASYSTTDLGSFGLPTWNPSRRPPSDPKARAVLGSCRQEASKRQRAPGVSWVLRLRTARMEAEKRLRVSARGTGSTGISCVPPLAKPGSVEPEGGARGAVEDQRTVDRATENAHEAVRVKNRKHLAAAAVTLPGENLRRPVVRQAARIPAAMNIPAAAARESPCEAGLLRPEDERAVALKLWLLPGAASHASVLGPGVRK